MGRKSVVIHHISVTAFLEAKMSFQHYLETIGRNPKSCQHRLRYISEFFAWMEQQGVQSLETITYAHVLGYATYLRQRTNQVKGGLLSEKFINAQLWLIEKMFGYLQLTGRINHNPTSKLEIKFPRDSGQRTILSQAEIK